MTCRHCPRPATHAWRSHTLCRDCYEAAVMRETREDGNGWPVGRVPVEKRKKPAKEAKHVEPK